MPVPPAGDVPVVPTDLNNQVTIRGPGPMVACTRPDLKHIGILGKEYFSRTEEAVSDKLWVCGAVVGHRVRRVILLNRPVRNLPLHSLALRGLLRSLGSVPTYISCATSPEQRMSGKGPLQSNGNLTPITGLQRERTVAGLTSRGRCLPLSSPRRVCRPTFASSALRAPTPFARHVKWMEPSALDDFVRV